MKTASIRFRITATAVVAVGIVLLATALGVTLSQRSQLTAALDATLRQRADDIAALVGSADPTSVEFGASREEGFVQLIATGGRVVAASPNLENDDELSIEYTLGADETVRTVSGLPVDDDAFRVLSRTITTTAGPAKLHVGTTYDLVIESTEALTASLAVSIPVVVVLLGGLVWVLVGKTLRPVEGIRAEVAAIGTGDLDRRVSPPSTGDEITLLAATMNQMLDRIEDSVTRQQRFVADASHELRSPLTRMRSEIEVTMAEVAGEEYLRLESLLAEAIALQNLVEDLLYLARSDAGGPPMAPELVDLDDVVLAEARRLRNDRRITLDMKAVSAAQVRGNPAELARAVRNLIDNATRHATSTVTLSLCEQGSSTVLAVGDDGPGVAPGHEAVIFERFVRLDDSRSRSSGGTGLGLSITRDIVHHHGGTIEVDATGESGTWFVVRLPRS